MSEMAIPVDELYKIVRNCLTYPYPQICRHTVALELLDVIKRHGGEVSKDLLRAVVQADDEKAMQCLRDYPWRWPGKE